MMHIITGLRNIIMIPTTDIPIYNIKLNKNHSCANNLFSSQLDKKCLWVYKLRNIYFGGIKWYFNKSKI